MRSPQTVLETLRKHAQETQYQYERLYRNLYNPQFYLLAYQNLYANKGSMTPGADGKTISGMSMKRIEDLVEKIRDRSYQPHPARRQYIPKKSGNGLRPLGIPSTDDKLVQEAVRMILESIYEPNFKQTSHGFRPNRSCHTALAQIQRTFTGVSWFVEGDIKGCFDNIDHHILIGILKRRIKDEAFIDLIWKLLRAGYIEDWMKHQTYTGTYSSSTLTLMDISVPIVPKGVTVSGTIKSYGSNTDAVTVTLTKQVETATAFTDTLTGNSGSYSIPTVPAGTYTLKVMKKGHAPWTESITVGDGTVTKDVTVYLIGDVNGDGDITIIDVTLARRHYKGAATLTNDQIKRIDINQDTCTRLTGSTELARGKVHYALMPVWMLNTKWQGKDFLFAMNGQTGKLVGDLPVSWGKFWGMFAGIAALLSIVGSIGATLLML